MMSDETDPKQAMEERQATSEGRAETGPLTGIAEGGGSQPGGAKPVTGLGSTAGLNTNDEASGGTEHGNTAAPPNR
jgi:hypothetical protein